MIIKKLSSRCLPESNISTTEGALLEELTVAKVIAKTSFLEKLKAAGYY